MGPKPVCAFDISSDGAPLECAIDAPLTDGWRWLHFEMSDPDLPAWLQDRVPSAVATALLSSETRPRFDLMDYSDEGRTRRGALMNLRGVNLNEGSDPEDMVALRIWATPRLVVTMRRRRIMAVDAIRRQMEAGSAPATPSAFLAALTEGLTRRIEEVSLHLEDRVDDIEEAMIDGEDVAVEEVLELRQTLIKLRRFVGPQREALMRFAQATGDLPDALDGSVVLAADLHRSELTMLGDTFAKIVTTKDVLNAS